MKFNYQATILMGTVALASNFNAGQANAVECQLISVPWRWQLTQDGSSSTSVYAENATGSSFTTVPDSKDLNGSYKVNLLFEKPNTYCERLGNEPTDINLSIVGAFTGVLRTDFLAVPLIPGLEGPFAGASAYVSILPAFNNETLFVGQKDINQMRSTAITVQDQQRISFSGYLDAFAYKGLTIGSEGFSLASAQLYVNGAFTGTTSGTVDYKVPVPEPLTIFGSATGVGFAAFFKRKHSKKQKKC